MNQSLSLRVRLSRSNTVKLQPVQKALVQFGLRKVLPFHGDLPRRFFVPWNNTIQCVSIRCAKNHFKDEHGTHRKVSGTMAPIQ